MRERSRGEREKERDSFKSGAVVPVLCGQSRENHGRSTFQRGQVSTSILATTNISCCFSIFLKIVFTGWLQLVHLVFVVLLAQFFKQNISVIVYKIKD